VVIKYTEPAPPPSGYTFVGFRQPVDNGGTVNIVKGGSVVPFKFTAYDGESLVTDPALISVLVERMSCSAVSSASSDVIEFTAPGSTALRWDGTQFVHNWRIPTGKSLCYRVTYRAAEAPGVAPASADDELVALFRTR